MLKNTHSVKNTQISDLFYTKRKVYRLFAYRKIHFGTLYQRQIIGHMTHREIETYGIIILLDHMPNEFIERTSETLVLGILGKTSHNQPRQRRQPPRQF